MIDRFHQWVKILLNNHKDNFTIYVKIAMCNMVSNANDIFPRYFRTLWQ